MGRAYAGTLGPVASAIALTRGLLHGGDVQSTILAACGSLFVFALFGCIAGQLAERFVRESVRKQFQDAVAAYQNKLPVSEENKRA